MCFVLLALHLFQFFAVLELWLIHRHHYGQHGKGKERSWGGERDERGELRKGGKERGRDLLDQCQTTSYAPVSDCMGRPKTYYLFVCIRRLPVGTVIFDTNNHEAN